MTKKQPAETPQADSASVLATDAHAGKGGQYVFDPATGERRPMAVPAPITQPGDIDAANEQSKE